MSLIEKGVDAFIQMIRSWIEAKKDQVARIYRDAIRPMSEEIRSQVTYLSQEIKYFEAFDLKFAFRDPTQIVSQERAVALRAFSREQQGLADEIGEYSTALQSLFGALRRFVDDARTDTSLQVDLTAIFERYRSARIAEGARFYPEQLNQDLTALLNRVIQGGGPGSTDVYFPIWQDHGGQIVGLLTGGRREGRWLAVVRERREVVRRGKALVEKFELIEDELYRQGALDDLLKQGAETPGDDGGLLGSFERPIFP